MFKAQLGRIGASLKPDPESKAAWKSFFTDAQVGLAITVLLYAIATFSAGGKNAFAALDDDFTFIHPILVALPIFLVGLLMAMQGAVLRDEYAYLLSFVLPFVAHAFSVGTGVTLVYSILNGLNMLRFARSSDGQFPASLYLFMTAVLAVSGLFSHVGLRLAIKEQKSAQKPPTAVGHYSVWLIGLFSVGDMDLDEAAGNLRIHLEKSFGDGQLVFNSSACLPQTPKASKFVISTYGSSLTKSLYRHSHATDR